MYDYIVGVAILFISLRVVNVFVFNLVRVWLKEASLF